MKGFLLVGLLLAASPSWAQSVHKCFSASGETTYQSDPCPAGQNVARTWDARAPEVTPAQQRRIDRDRYAAELAAQQRRQQVTAPSYRIRGQSASSAKHARCEAAKAQRNRWVAENPRRTFEQRRRWDDTVYQACKP